MPRFGGRRRGGPSRGGSTVRSRRRPLEWECAELVDRISLPVNNCDQAVILQTGEFDEEYSDSTLVRCRGHLEIYAPFSIVTGRYHAFGAAGIIELSGQASEDPLALVDCPLSDCESDWLWHTYWSVLTDAAGGATGQTNQVHHIMEIDAKARRKLESGASSLWFVIENALGSDVAVEYWFGVRTLIAEK